MTKKSLDTEHRHRTPIGVITSTQHGRSLAIWWCVVLAVAVCCAVVVGAEPVLQYTDCENIDAGTQWCSESTASYYGASFFWRVALSVAVCVAALISRSLASALLCVILISLVLVSTPYGIYFYPVLGLAVVGVVLTIWRSFRGLRSHQHTRTV